MAEIIDRYIRTELDRKERTGKVAKLTADEYRRQAPALRAEFGSKRYAVTSAESMRPDVLRKADVSAYLRRVEGKRGAVAANRSVALLSAVFSFADEAGVCTYNPCTGVRRNEEEARKNVLSEEVRAKIMAAAAPALGLIAAMSDVTTLRKTDIRLLMLSQVAEESIRVTPSKTKRKTGTVLEFAITPAVRAILDEAKALPGRRISLYVFPTRRGTPYTESALQSAWTRAKLVAGLVDVDATFRDIRTTELNAIHREGGDATAAAGHADKRTTERHYLSEPTKIRPRR